MNSRLRLAPVLVFVVAPLVALSTGASADPGQRLSSSLEASLASAFLSPGAPYGLIPGEQPPPSPGAADKVGRAVGGGVNLGVSLSETNWNTGVGFGVSGFGIYTRDLLPGKNYPFPGIFTVDAEILFFSAESDISDILFTAHACFGVDLLYRMDLITLFPYAGVGLGFESLSGSKTVGVFRINANDTNLVFPWEMGMGFVYKLNPGMAVFARFGFSFPLNAANISFFMRMQGGLLFEI